MGIQVEELDYNCSVYGLNIAKAVARIGLNKLPVTQESLVNELPDEISCMKAFIYDDIGYSRGLEEMASTEIEQQITEVKLDDLILSDEKALIGITECNEEVGNDAIGDFG